MGKRPTSNQAVERYRQNMRKAGLRLVQLWVPDTRDPRLAGECRRQSRLASRHPHERSILDVIEKVHDQAGWTA